MLAPGVTLWRRIADDLEQAIALGTHAAGERLPGEVEIPASGSTGIRSGARSPSSPSAGWCAPSAAAAPMWRAAASPIRSARARDSPRSSDRPAAAPTAVSSPMAASRRTRTWPSGSASRSGRWWCAWKFCAAPTGCRSPAEPTGCRPRARPTPHGSFAPPVPSPPRSRISASRTIAGNRPTSRRRPPTHSMPSGCNSRPAAFWCGQRQCHLRGAPSVSRARFAADRVALVVES